MWTTCRSPGRQSGAIDSATAIGPSKPRLVPEPELLAELAPQRLVERLAAVDAAAREQPVLLAGLLLPAEQHAVVPADQRGDADARRPSMPRRAEAADAPLGVGQLVDLDELDLGDRQDDELRDPHPGLDDERLARVGVEQVDQQLAAVARSRRDPGVLTIEIPCFAARPERGCTKPA